MSRDEAAKAIVIHMTGHPDEPTPTLLDILDAWWNEAAVAMRASIAAKLANDVEVHVHETWSYDNSTGAWEAPNTANEEWVSDREELVEELALFPIPASASGPTKAGAA